LAGAARQDFGGCCFTTPNGIRLCKALLVKIFGIELVEVQSPIEAGPADHERSQPESNLAVLAEIKPDFTRRHPKGRELALLEVADPLSGMTPAPGVPEYAEAEAVAFRSRHRFRQFCRKNRAKNAPFCSSCIRPNSTALSLFINQIQRFFRPVSFRKKRRFFAFSPR